MTSLSRICSHRVLVLLASAALSASTAPVAAESLDHSCALRIFGNVRDMHDQTSTMGFTFDVRFSDVRYEGQIHRLLIDRQDENTLSVKVALRNVQLNVNRTQIRGSRHSADCGPICLTLGTRRDLWIKFELQETGDDRLQLLGADFQLAADNWQIGSPTWVRTKGFGMTESRVVNGLRFGLEGNVKTVEQELVDELPAIFAQVEQRISQQVSVADLALN